MAAPDTSAKADPLTPATATVPSHYSQLDDDPSLPSPPFHDLVMLLEEISRKPKEKAKLLTAYLKVPSVHTCGIYQGREEALVKTDKALCIFIGYLQNLVAYTGLFLSS